ncbi:MAG: glycerol-3-phosphate dehydrogenase (NAD(P)+), partial [Bermanella sp.]
MKQATDNKFESGIAVIGAGSYGTALAFVLARNGNPTVLWGRDKQHVSAMRKTRRNNKYLPNAIFPDSLLVSSNLKQTLQSARDVLVVVPSHAFKESLQAIKPYLTEQHRLIWATKGLEPGTGRILQEVAFDVLGDTIPFAVVSGPTFAKEMVAGLPTAITLSSTNAKLCGSFSQKLHCSKGF